MFAVGKQGFEIIPELIDPRSVASVIESVENSPLRRSRAGIRNAFQLDSVRNIASDPRILDLAANILGENAFPFRATLFDKSVQSNWLVVWHQDTALPLRERRDAPGWGPWSVKEGVTCAHAPASALEKVLAIRLHLDDSDERNGSLRILPGTHTFGVLSDDAIHDLANKIVPVDCHVKAGGVLLMRPLLVHSSSKASSRAAQRRVLHIEYASCASFPDGIELCTSHQQGCAVQA